MYAISKFVVSHLVAGRTCTLKDLPDMLAQYGEPVIENIQEQTRNKAQQMNQSPPMLRGNQAMKKKSHDTRVSGYIRPVQSRTRGCCNEIAVNTALL